MWTFGNNVVVGVYSYDIEVEDSYYYDGCTDSIGHLKWEANKDEGFAKFHVIELEEWSPRTPPSTHFVWDEEECGFTPPNISCLEFPKEEIGAKSISQCNVNKPEECFFEAPIGACWEDWVNPFDIDDYTVI